MLLIYSIIPRICMSNILITGANGQLGNEFRRLGKGSVNHYIYTDAEDLDITCFSDIQTFFRQNKIDVVINCAAYTNVDLAEANEDTACKVNQEAVKNLSTVCKERDIFFIHISTDYVFDGTSPEPYTESNPTNPQNGYGRTKLKGEKAVEESGCRFLIFRTSWLYSVWGKNFVKTILRLLDERETLSVVFDQAGTPTYAGDLAEAIFQIVEKEQYKGKEGLYHYSNEGVCSWYDFAQEIARLSGAQKCKVLPCRSSEFPSVVKRPAYSVLDKTKVRKTFKIKIPYWRDSLKKCLELLIE